MSGANPIEPAQIFTELEAQPPLMRAQTAGTYIGREVYWALRFANGSEQHPGQAWLVFRFDSDHVRMVTGRVSLSDYPSLRSLRTGEAVLVSGRVHRIDLLSIELEIQDLVLAKTAEHPTKSVPKRAFPSPLPSPLEGERGARLCEAVASLRRSRGEGRAFHVGGALLVSVVLGLGWSPDLGAQPDAHIQGDGKGDQPIVDSEKSSTRYVEESAGFSYIVPNGWELKEFSGAPFKVAVKGADVIYVLHGESNASQEDFAAGNLKDAMRNLEDFKILNREDLTTLQGNTVTKVLMSAKRSGGHIPMYQYFYSRGSDKFVLYCVSESRWQEQELESLFDTTARSFRFED
jgi:hypothetical protein